MGTIIHPDALETAIRRITDIMSNYDTTQSVDRGGTGATNPADARKNLGIVEIHGEKGQTYFFNGQTDTSITPDKLLKVCRAVNSPQELATEMAKPVNMAEVFNHFDRMNNPSLVGTCTPDEEKTGWSYIEAQNTVECLPNSNGLIGFISNTMTDKYTHEMQLCSTSGDNDGIVVVIAAVPDDSIQVEGCPLFYHTLCAVVNASFESHILVEGVGTQWALAYDFPWDTHCKMIADGNDKILTQEQVGWSSRGVGRRVKVIRDGDYVSVITSQWDSKELDPSTTLTIDLSSDPLLEKFRGPQRYGYATISQPNSYFSEVLFCDANQMIVDLSGNKCYQYFDGRWSVNPSENTETQVGVGRFCLSTATGKLYYVRDVDDIVEAT